MRTVVAVLAAVVLAASACTGGTDGEGDDGITATVFAAASLAAPFEEIAHGHDVAFSFDGSAGLVDQIAGGAPADVLATADRRTMDRAAEQGLVVAEPTMFATNQLVLVTPSDNPAGITGLDDSLAGAKLVVCAPEVPCGGATQRLADAVGATLEPVSEESKVTDVLGKVTSGEADAGLVYLTDAMAAGDAVEMIEVPEAAEHPNTYWIAEVAGGDVDEARALIELVMGSQDVLADHGFGLSSA